MRLIDADKIPFSQSEDGCLNDVAYRYDINEMPTIEPTSIAPPSNDPLTLSELREMDGEPVWFETVYNDCIYECGWAIVSTEYERIAGNSTYFHFEDLGYVWIAYRRKPERGGDENG